ncbi:MAG: hypothetical protein QW728_05315 [Thermoplasmata archaeon]
MNSSLIKPRLPLSGAYLFFSVLLTILQVLINLWYIALFLNDDFSIAGVYSHSEKSLPWYYKISASWSSDEGVFLLFTTFLTITTLIYSKKFYETPIENTSEDVVEKPERKRHLFFSLLFLYAILLLLLLANISQNPFGNKEDLTTGEVPVDGLGLHPTLQHPLMIFHPPLTFLS